MRSPTSIHQFGVLVCICGSKSNPTFLRSVEHVVGGLRRHGSVWSCSWVSKEYVLLPSFFVVCILVSMDLGLYGFVPNVRADMSVWPWNVTAVIAECESQFLTA